MNSAQCITKRHKCSKVAADCAAEHGIEHGYTHCPCQVPTGISILHTSATDPAPMNSSCHSRPNATSVAKWPAIVPLTEHPHEQFAVDHDLVELLTQGRVWGCSVVSYLHLTYFVTLHLPVNSAGYGWRLGDMAMPQRALQDMLLAPQDGVSATLRTRPMHAAAPATAMGPEGDTLSKLGAEAPVASAAGTAHAARKKPASRSGSPTLVGRGAHVGMARGAPGQTRAVYTLAGVLGLLLPGLLASVAPAPAIVWGGTVLDTPNIAAARGERDAACNMRKQNPLKPVCALYALAAMLFVGIIIGEHVACPAISCKACPLMTRPARQRCAWRVLVDITFGQQTRKELRWIMPPSLEGTPRSHLTSVSRTAEGIGTPSAVLCAIPTHALAQ